MALSEAEVQNVLFDQLHHVQLCGPSCVVRAVWSELRAAVMVRAALVRAAVVRAVWSELPCSELPWSELPWSELPWSEHCVHV